MQAGSSGYRAATVYIMFIIICGEMCACGSLIRSVITHDTVEYTHKRASETRVESNKRVCFKHT